MSEKEKAMAVNLCEQICTKHPNIKVHPLSSLHLESMIAKKPHISLMKAKGIGTKILVPLLL
ncbi:hypothetical protein SDC9_21999 [bioreactor metagenome]|uniref:Uncharacterized protein n=1 Tax=bioreactor metagenome TaxID=1076179 RepID=A0A644UB72_9ZZZZ|nr:hypothetical protein [Desulfitobacterium hafniense]MEA5022196.1 hypothetical protein [Desulfitobacterium hafniense]